MDAGPGVPLEPRPYNRYTLLSCPATARHRIARAGQALTAWFSSSTMSTCRCTYGETKARCCGSRNRGAWSHHAHLRLWAAGARGQCVRGRQSRGGGQAHLLDERDPFQIRGLIRSEFLSLARALAIITLHEVLTLVHGDCDETEDSALEKRTHRTQRAHRTQRGAGYVVTVHNQVWRRAQLLRIQKLYATPQRR